jgi:hypothetical protein
LVFYYVCVVEGCIYRGGGELSKDLRFANTRIQTKIIGRVVAAIWERNKQQWQWDLGLIDCSYSYDYFFSIFLIPLLFISCALYFHITRQNESFTASKYKYKHQPTHIIMFMSLPTLLRVLVASAASIPFVAAQTSETEITTEQLYGTLSSTAAPAPGFNVGGGSVFTNYVNAFNNKQLFMIRAGSGVYEKPATEPVQFTFLHWCSDLTFSDISNSSLMGLAGRCVQMVLAGNAEALASGAQLTFDNSEGQFTSTLGISAVFSEQLNVFEGQYHKNTDDLTIRYWDDGRKTTPFIIWEGHDEGDMSPNSATSSFSRFGDLSWITVEEAAQLFNTSVDEFTPAKFTQVYLDTWIKEHEKEAVSQNPNTEAELEIIEQVQNETDSAGETTAPAAPGTAEDGVTDPIDDSASGRKLASVAARFASAALRVFGI